MKNILFIPWLMKKLFVKKSLPIKRNNIVLIPVDGGRYLFYMYFVYQRKIKNRAFLTKRKHVIKARSETLQRGRWPYT